MNQYAARRRQLDLEPPRTMNERELSEKWYLSTDQGKDPEARTLKRARGTTAATAGVEARKIGETLVFGSDGSCG